MQNTHSYREDIHDRLCKNSFQLVIPYHLTVHSQWYVDSPTI